MPKPKRRSTIPLPIVRKTTRVGKGQVPGSAGIGGTSDTFFISYHGYVHTHMDTICHFLYEGKMYNGYSQDEVTEDGAAKTASSISRTASSPAAC